MQRRKTLRKFTPNARKLAQAANALEREAKRLRALVPVVMAYEQVYNRLATAAPGLEGEIPDPGGCEAHGDSFDVNCTACSDALFNRSVAGMQAKVLRGKP